MIERTALEGFLARGIHKDPRPQMEDHQVARLLGTQRHGVLQARTPAFFHGKAESVRMAILPDEVEKRTRGVVSHCDHVLFL